MSRHVVVVGYGMVGARFVEEVRRRDPEGLAVQLTVVGAEPHPAYNRVLLSSVLAGAMTPESVRLHDPGWGTRHRVAVRTATRVSGIDRAGSAVVLDTGERLGYDALVLATGSSAWLPPVEGLAGPGGEPAEGVSTFRELGDCHRILEQASSARHVAVLGGGLLGLESARGLAGRGTRVTVLHPAGHLMERQLDAEGGRVLGQSLSALGVRVRLATAATRWQPARGLHTDRGDVLPCDAVVVAAGVRAETRLARAAGLALGAGVLVDDRLATSDPRVHALGDCAEHPATAAGLIQPGWEQAAVLADLLTGADPGARYRGTPVVTRLKAQGLDVAALGEAHTEDTGNTGNTGDTGNTGNTEDAGASGDGEPAGPPGQPAGGAPRDHAGGGDTPEIVRLSDPARGRYAKLVLRRGTVTGGVLLGVPDAAARVVQLFDRGAPVPSDRLALLLGRALPGSGQPVDSPVRLPGHAVICRCNAVTKAALTTAWQAGAADVEALATATRAGTGCGSCRDAVAGICEWLAAGDPGPETEEGAA